jgi:hypothetical protein
MYGEPVMNWVAAAGAGVVAAAVVLLPGLAVTVSLRLRGITAVALAGPIGFALIGISGVVFGVAHVRFGWWAPVVVTVLVVAVLLGCRTLVERRRGPLPGWDSWRSFLPIALAAAASALAIGLLAFGAVPAPDRISQTYDAVFHLNAAQYVTQSGDASSLHLYRLVNPTKAVAFYPAVWHSIVALTAGLTGLSIPAATNAAWIGTAGPLFPLGVAFAAATLLGSAGPGRSVPVPHQRTAVAAAAALLGSAFATFPYLLLDFGTLYPNGLAYTLLPTGLVLIALLLPWPERVSWRPEPAPRGRVILLAVGWVTAAAFTHPRSMVAIGALAAPLLVAWFVARMRALAASGARGRRAARITSIVVVAGVVVAAVLALAFIYVYYDVANRPVADRLNGKPAIAREDFGAALLQALLSTSLVSPSQLPLPVPLLLAAVVLVGLVALALRPGLRWLPASFVLLAVLYASAAGSDSDLAKLLTGLWDKDKFRIIAIVPTIAVPIAAWAVVVGTAEVVAVLRRRALQHRDPRRRTLALLTAGVTVVVAASAWASTATSMTPAIGHVFRLQDAKHGGLLDVDEVALLARVSRTVPPGQLIADNPWNGTSLAWAIGGRQTLFPHFGGYWGTQRKLIAAHLDAYRSRPAVCEAVHDLKLHWVVADPQRLKGFKKEAHAFRGIDRIVRGRAVTKVDSVGSTALYRLDACWTKF